LLELSRWIIHLDGKGVGSTASEPYSVSIDLNVPNGVHTITAKVTDKYGGTAETSIDIQVKKDTTDPVADIVIDSQSGLDITVNGSGSTDNEGIVSYSWDFGDGTKKSGVTASHTYASGDTYTITLTVTDGAGLSNSTSIDVTLP